MDASEKLKALRSLHLLDQIPEAKLATLSDHLKPLRFADGSVLFEEGSPGDSLYFISQGHVRISKKVKGEKGAAFKDLAIIGPGDCIGEMSLMDPGPRSASAIASGDTVAFQLESRDLHAWLKSNPEEAVGFFAELVHVLTRRLRRSSSELTLLFDLSQWLLEPIGSGKELLQKVLDHLVPHLEGQWTGYACLYNEFNEEMEHVAANGPGAAEAAPPCPNFAGRKTLWLDGRTFGLGLPGPKGRLDGYLLFRASAEPAADLKNEIARTLGTAGGLIASALENIRFRTEDQLRDRLKSARSQSTF